MMLERRTRKKALTLILIVAAALFSGHLFQTEMRQDLSELRQILNEVEFEDSSGQLYDKTRTEFVRQVGFNGLTQAKLVDPELPVFLSLPHNNVRWRAPGYIRTLTFSVFDGQTWNNEPSPDNSFVNAADLNDIPPSNLDPRSTRTFTIRPAYEQPLRRYEIKVYRGRGRLVPAPVGTAILRGNSTSRSKLELDSHGYPAPGSLLNDRYEVYVQEGSAETAVAPAAEYLESLTIGLGQDRSFLAAESKRLCQGATSVTEKAKAIESYFRSNFEYSLDTVPGRGLRGRSELRAFLEDRRAAHCEYFATAATLLLRAQGIPARLVTGYLAYEYDDENDGFLARNRDAHAWAEAYDADAQVWIRVEATPGTQGYIDQMTSVTAQAFGMNQASDSLAQGGLLDSMRWTIQRIQIWWANQLSRRYAWLYPLLGFMLLLLLPPLIRWLRPPQDPFLSKQVRDADRHALRLGYRRASHETCHQFALRLVAAGKPQLEELGNWYKEHAESRYSSDA